MGLLLALVAAVTVAVFPIIEARLPGLFSGWESAVQAIWTPNNPQ